MICPLRKETGVTAFHLMSDNQRPPHRAAQLSRWCAVHRNWEMMGRSCDLHFGLIYSLSVSPQALGYMLHVFYASSASCQPCYALRTDRMLWTDHYPMARRAQQEGMGQGSVSRASAGDRAPAGETVARGWHPINRDNGEENLTLKRIRGDSRSCTRATRLVG